LATESTPSPDELAKRLSGYELLHHVPEEQLHWLASQGTLRTLQPGEVLFQKEDPIEFLFIILKGKIQFKLEQKGEHRVINELVEGDISGALPYSRAKNSIALAEARGDTQVLQLSKSLFRDMIHKHPELTEALVHVMTSRVRDFTREQQQTEKLAALGRLSAGLHHELNNPAAAALSASIELGELLREAPEKFKALVELQLTPEQVDKVNNLLFRFLENKENKSLSMLERSSLEDEIAAWLEEQNVEDPYEKAETFAQHTFDPETLHSLKEICGEKPAAPVADWIFNALATDKLVADIQESTRRISSLVGAVKTYSHMDRSPERERIDLEKSIRNTLTMLNFKLKKKKIKVAVEAQEDLPNPCVYPGELNQVWTNLIDNAIDAMDEGGQLTISLKLKESDIEAVVTDTGSGIPEDELQRIFDPFYTTKALGQGSGMGLDLSKKIIEKHGGSIAVSSKPGQTSFTIRLPENPTT
jgi:signal transduction histidine kinase